MAGDANERGATTGRSKDTGGTRTDEEQARIDALSAKVDDARNKAADFTKQVAELGAELAALKARRTERKKAAETYGTAAKQVTDELETLRPIIDQKLRMAEAGIGDQKESIEAVVTKVDKAVTTAETQATEAEDKARDTVQKQADAEAAEQAANEALADVKRRPTALGPQVKEARALVDQAAKAEDKNETAAMYFLLSQAQSVLADVTLQTPEQYEHDLGAAVAKADDARAYAAAAKQTAATARDDATAKRKAADDARKARRADVLKELANLPAPEPASVV